MRSTMHLCAIVLASFSAITYAQDTVNLYPSGALRCLNAGMSCDDIEEGDCCSFTTDGAIQTFGFCDSDDEHKMEGFDEGVPDNGCVSSLGESEDDDGCFATEGLSGCKWIDEDSDDDDDFFKRKERAAKMAKRVAAGQCQQANRYTRRVAGTRYSVHTNSSDFKLLHKMSDEAEMDKFIMARGFIFKK